MKKIQWKLMFKECLDFSFYASLISPSKIFCLRSNIKHSTQSLITIEVRQKYSTARRIFNCFIAVSAGVETLRLMLDILHQKI